MKEIWVPEVVVVVFLALPLFRLFVKDSLRSRTQVTDGFVWLPVIALGITIGIFPAYGFRPECLPILVFCLLINVLNLFSFIFGITVLNQKALVKVAALILLTAAAVPMFAFSPRSGLFFRQLAGGREKTAGLVRMFKIENSDKVYFVRIYGIIAPEIPSPLIFLVPPEIGSAASVDLVCMQLMEKSFTVVTYFREDFDIPVIDENGRKRIVSPIKLLKYRHIVKKAADRPSGNRMGKMLEAERRSDVEFLLPLLPSFLNSVGYNALPPVVLAGYGAGGSALACLVGENDFMSRFGKVLGVVAVESRLWSSYQVEGRHVPDVPASVGIIQRCWSLFVRWLYGFRPQRVIRSGPLPGTGLSESGIPGAIPVLYLVSGRALMKPKPYQAVFDALYSGSAPAALAAVESAGPLDYQDFPFTHPLYSFLLPGLKRAQKSENPINDTAGIIGNFIKYLLEREKIGTLPRQSISGSLYIESRGLSAFRL